MSVLLYLVVSVAFLPSSYSLPSSSPSSSPVTPSVAPPFRTSNVTSCPTFGISVTVLVSISPDVDIVGFFNLLTFFGRIIPDGPLPYSFFFGSTALRTGSSENLRRVINNSWSQQPQLQDLYTAAMREDTHTGGIVSDSSLVETINKLIDLVKSMNSDSATVAHKKNMILVTDYVHSTIISLLNALNVTNTEVTAIYYPYDTSSFSNLASFKVYSPFEEAAARDAINGPLPFVVPSASSASARVSSNIFLLGPFEPSLLAPLVDRIVGGDECRLSDVSMSDRFIRVCFRGTSQGFTELWLPWLGNSTGTFANNCVGSFRSRVDGSYAYGDVAIYDEFVNSLSEGTVFSVLVSSLPLYDLSQLISLDNPPIGNGQAHYSIYSTLLMSSIYDSLVRPMESEGLLAPSLDNHVLSLNNSFLTFNMSTVCASWVPQASLVPAVPYKSFELALTDLIWISSLAAVAAILTGAVLYAKARRELSTEDQEQPIVEPVISRTAKNCPRAEQMPWKVSGGRVRLDTSVRLGEGLRANVFLGHLTGRAPLMEWAPNSAFADCDVAIRVSREHGEEEEDELDREIACMQRLRGHPNLSMFLGWARLDDAVCSLLELTTSTLPRHLHQLRNVLYGNVNDLARESVVNKLKEIMAGTCAGLEYIHSRNLVHRDICARNVLLTANLTPKIGGFEFCSSPKDMKFKKGSPSYSRLPIRWMSPEAFHAEFSPKSDVWSLGMLLYETFSLGETPLADVSDEEVERLVERGFRCEQPRFAPPDLWHRSLKCWHRLPTHRPSVQKMLNLLVVSAHPTIE